MSHDSWSLSSLTSGGSHSGGGSGGRALLVAGATAFALCLGALAWLCTSDASPWSRGSQKRRIRDKDVTRPQPLLVELKNKRGKVQGMDWVEATLKKDNDGDEAHEFLGPF